LDKRPIGVFDSGLGGLTAIKELRRQLPGEDVVYFGDTGRVPYGTKGRDTIRKYTAQIMRFLRGFDIKAVIIACNTVSAVAFDTAAQSHIPVVGAVEPAAEAALKVNKNGRIGILGTSATIGSGAYEKAILSRSPGMQLRSRACPLFVPLVESGHFRRGDELAKLAAHDYLKDIREWGPDTVILGCTHYPILRDVISDEFGSGVTLIDSGRESAAAACRQFGKMGLLSGRSSGGECDFYVSDYTEDFRSLAEILLEEPLGGTVKKIDIEKY
jgi:glutamate racemase